MTRATPFEAVIADMDGVLTRTARLHQRAWKRLFDDFLGPQGEPPFDADDYRAHVDGKPRYDGVADFLASRGIDLPRGDPDDPPGDETACALGNRKNAIFHELLETDGVELFDDAVEALARWRRGGLKLAVVSASRNCRQILGAAGLEGQVDAIVDGKVAHVLGLGGKRGMMCEAAARLGVAPANAVVLEDAVSGVSAARAEQFGLVVGVDRGGQASRLEEAGAHRVVQTVSALRFPRRIPAALERLDVLDRLRAGRTPAVFLDYDGTLSPIVDDPADAVLTREMREVVQSLSERCDVLVVSGRDRRDIEERVGIDGLLYAGSHGLDIAGRDHERVHPEAEAAAGEVDRVEERLYDGVAEIPGVIIERKRFSVAVHYRQVAAERVGEVLDRTDGVVSSTSLRQRPGKKVVEIVPAVDWDKGRALTWIAGVLELDPADRFLLYLGDDETDEDAFAALSGRGIGLYVGPAVADTLADYRLADTEEVRRFLAWLV